jgi:opacity protein-like surface antigen
MIYMKRITVISVFVAGLLASAATLSAAVESKTATLKPGATLAMGENYVRYNTVLSADFTFTDFSSLLVGRGGEDVYRGHWIEVTPVHVIVRECNYVEYKDHDGKKKKILGNYIREGYRHGLDIRENLSIKVTADFTTALVEVSTSTGKWSRTIKWFGGGAAFARNGGEAPADVNLSFDRCNADKDFWFYGDSYASYGQARWLYHARLAGFDNCMVDNLPGGKSADLLTAFFEDLKFGTPKYAVWMLGMNDKNDGDEADASWMDCVEDFLTTCKRKGITPVITAVPYVPKRVHAKKIEYARERGCRVLDWAEAVESTPDGSWADKCLSKDNVHPTRDGAERLWERMMKDIPEMMNKR